MTPPVDADDDYDAELDQSPPDLAAMVTEALGRGLGNTETMLEARQRADAFWADYEARSSYEKHVADRQALAEANEETSGLLEQAAKRHGVASVGGRRGP